MLTILLRIYTAYGRHLQGWGKSVRKYFHCIVIVCIYDHVMCPSSSLLHYCHVQVFIFMLSAHMTLIKVMFWSEINGTYIMMMISGVSEGHTTVSSCSLIILIFKMLIHHHSHCESVIIKNALIRVGAKEGTTMLL